MEKKLNILFIASWYPNKDLPFNGDFVQRHAQAVALFANVTVVHIASSRQKENLILEEKNLKNVKEIRVYHRRIVSKIFFIRYFKNFIIKFKALKIALRRAGKQDIVHLNVLYPGGLFALYIKWKYKIPYIATEHWSKFLPDSKEKFSFIEFFAIRKIMRNAEFICPVSESLKLNMQKIETNVKYQVIPNVVDTHQFYPAKQKNTNLIFRFIHISGMLDEIKNITGILNAVKIAYSENQNFTLTFVGSDDVEKYKEYANRIGIPKHILLFKGIVNYNEVAKLLREYNALLMFSNYETLSCVTQEALISGIPVVSSGVNGVLDLINKTNGILVERQNEKALANAMIQLIENYKKFDNVKIAANAKTLYSYETVGKQYLNLYLKVLGKNNN